MSILSARRGLQRRSHYILHNIQTLKLSGAVKKGDRIAQLILERIMTPEVEEVEELDSTIRGSGGYGSTGVAN